MLFKNLKQILKVYVNFLLVTRWLKQRETPSLKCLLVHPLNPGKYGGLFGNKIDKLPSNLTTSAEILASHVANSSRVKMENDCDMSVGPVWV
jgi:hypothetical protein